VTSALAPPEAVGEFEITKPVFQSF
jgi:hypothetical protein